MQRLSMLTRYDFSSSFQYSPSNRKATCSGASSALLGGATTFEPFFTRSYSLRPTSYSIRRTCSAARSRVSASWRTASASRAW